MGRSGEAFFETKASSLGERGTPLERGVRGSIAWFIEQTEETFYFSRVSEHQQGKVFLEEVEPMPSSEVTKAQGSATLQLLLLLSS